MHLALSRGRFLQWQFITGLMLVVLAGCSSAPKSSSSLPSLPGSAPTSRERDGPDVRPQPDLANVPDAEPRVEPIRSNGPNKPYAMFGRQYVPFIEDRPYTERGVASWYGRKFHGRRTASGEVYNMYAMTAAHPTLPLPSYARVFNPANRREVVVRINDRGPFHRGRIIDLSYAAAHKLGMLHGVAPVEVTRITFDEIRTGSWKRGGDGNTVASETTSTGAAGAGVLSVAQPVSAPLDDTGGSLSAAPAEVTADNAQAPMQPAPGFWVQLGAFSVREGAEAFQRRVAVELEWLAPLLGVLEEPKSYRLQAGPYANRDEASEVARRVRQALQLVPVIAERR
jgi:rare lipoprotein A